MTSLNSSKAFVRDRASHTWLDPFPGERIASHLTGQETDGKFSCGEALLDPGAGQPLHVHHNLDELLYVLDGDIDFELEGRRFRTGPGGTVFIPQGSPHGFRNLGSVSARMLGVFSPSALDGFFEAMQGQPASAFPEIAQGFGIEIVGPMLEYVQAQ